MSVQFSVVDSRAQFSLWFCVEKFCVILNNVVTDRFSGCVVLFMGCVCVCVHTIAPSK